MFNYEVILTNACKAKRLYNDALDEAEVLGQVYDSTESDSDACAYEYACNKAAALGRLADETQKLLDAVNAFADYLQDDGGEAVMDAMGLGF